MFSVLSIFLALFSLATAYKAPLLGESHTSAIAGQYIVRYKDDVVHGLFAQDLLQATRTFNVLHQYKHAFRGYSAKLTDEQLEAVRANPNVAAVEVDSVVRISACSNPVPAGSWGLTRVSQRHMNLNSQYSAPTTAGRGVTVYVVDTGIYVSNNDFEGRATFGWKAEPTWSSTDANGHGTHVSSTIVGRNYGLAKEATVIGVKVLGDDGSGTNSGVIGGIDWAVSQFIAGGRRPSVINMSLGGGFSSFLNAAVNNAYQEGIVVVVAAGNENQDACNTSPASASDVISVGSTTIGAGETDARSSFSNWGECVDVFAPGSDITAAWIGSPSAVLTISGTSMASPHVAGVATLFWSQDLTATAAAIRGEILSTATPNLINLACPPGSKGCSSSPNKLAFTGCVEN